MPLRSVPPALWLPRSSPARGVVELKVKAKGKSKRKLNRTGKAKLKVTITFTPTAGNPTSEQAKVKLKH